LAGLEVAVDDALRVGRGQSLAGLDGGIDRLWARSGPLLETIGEGLALEELEYDVGLALLKADVEDGENLRMIEGAGRAGFDLESAPPVGIRLRVRADHLDRDLAPEAGIARAVHLAHASGPERRGDDVGGRGAYPGPA
jgi:hypothetical protein